MPVNTEHKEYAASLNTWTKCRDCFAGSDKVKSRGVVYLPALDSHSSDVIAYNYYKMRALFFNATRRTVQGLAGAVFQRGPVVNVDETLTQQLKNVTLTGKDVETFGLSLLKEVLITGRTGVLVDMGDANDPKSRPYWVQYSPEAIINWSTTLIEGMPVLTRVVLRETYYEPRPEDEFTLEEKDQYRVLNLTINGEIRTYSQSIYRKDGDKWTIVKSIIPTRSSNPLPFIPFIFLGPTTIQPAVEDSPILDLVEVNLSHYRTSADLEHGLHWTACPTPWAAGITLPGGEKLKIGSGEAWVFPDANGKAGMLEFTGAGLGALAAADEKKRKMMSALGARLLEDSISSESTLGIKMRASGEHASLRTIVQQLELALTWCAKVHAWWLSTSASPEDEKAVITVNKDFIVGQLAPEQVNALIALLQAEAISYATFYEKLMQGEMTREGVDAEMELKDIDTMAGRFKLVPVAPTDPNNPDKKPEDKKSAPVKK